MDSSKMAHQKGLLEDICYLRYQKEENSVLRCYE